MADERHAHYLHEKKGLAAVTTPTIERPRAIGWVGTSEKLLVATESDGVVELDPIMGMRELDAAVSDPAELAVSPDGQLFVVVERGRGVSVRRTSDGVEVGSTAIGLLSDIAACWFQLRPDETGIAVAGDDLDGRKVIVLNADCSRRRVAAVPPRTAIGAGRTIGLLCARVTEGGLQVAQFGKPINAEPPSKHRLRFSASGILLGIADGGITVWRGPKDAPHTFPTYDVSAAAVNTTGSLVAIGTRTGDVALTSIEHGSFQRARPGRVGAHSGAVRTVAFAAKGRWLATAADELRLWTW